MMRAKLMVQSVEEAYAGAERVRMSPVCGALDKDDPCEGCNSAPVDCVGVADCERLKA